MPFTKTRYRGSVNTGGKTAWLVLLPITVESVLHVALWHLLTFLSQSQQTPPGVGHPPTKPLHQHGPAA